MGTLFRISYLLGVFCLIFVAVKVPFVGISIHDFFLFSAVAIWLVEFVIHQGADGWTFPLHPLWIAGFLVLIGGLLSSPDAVTPVSSLVVTVKTVFVLTLWVSLTMVVVQRGGFWQTVWVFVAAVVVVSGIAVFDRATGTDIGGTISGRQVPFYQRSDGTLAHPNELAYLTSVGLPIIAGLLLHEIQTERRAKMLVALAVMTVLVALTIYLTGSVSGYLGVLIAMALLFTIVLIKSNARIRIGTAVLIGVLGLAVFTYLSVTQQSAQMRQFIADNLDRAIEITGPDRIALVAQSVDVMAANPFVGFGMDQSATGGLLNSQRVTTVGIHNVTFASWVSGGLFALAGMTFGYFVSFLTGIHAMRRGAQRLDWVIVALGAASFAWLFFDQTQPSLHHRTSWFTTALLFGAGYQIRFFMSRR
jgi:hypothetical protein